MISVRLHDTLTRKKVTITPLVDYAITLYVCGITPYDETHIGHARCYIVFDVLYRLLHEIGYNVVYVRNYTDIDDKLLAKAERQNDADGYRTIADEYIEKFEEQMAALNCVTPMYQPRVTTHIKEIISFIASLVEAGVAYQLDGDVYFDITSFDEYGKLSGRDLDDLRAGARVDVNKAKRNPGDFALWKGNDQQLFWQSPWGYGRPGWHIECSALARKYLGDSINIHGGGMDLIFPHHENEIAQTESLTHKQFAQCWLHNALVNMGGEKMSKSLGNIFTLSELFERFHPLVVRLYMLQHHYRTPIAFSPQGLDAARTAYVKLAEALADIDYDERERELHRDEELLAVLADDLNTPKILGMIFDRIKQRRELEKTKYFIEHVLGLTLKEITERRAITPEIQKLINERLQARKNRDWKRADQIRDTLKDMGIDIHDEKIT